MSEHLQDGVLPRRSLGRTGISITELGFGGTAIGNMYSPVSDADAYGAVEAAWHGGIRFFDTAPHYGLGLSEKRLGAILSDKPRDDYVLSTKVGRLLVPNPSPQGSDLRASGYDVPDAMSRVWDFSRDGVRRSIEASMQRLGVDRLDIVVVHDPDDHLDEAIHQAIPALLELRDEGVIGAVGAGMNAVAPLSRFAAETDVDMLMVAGRWTLYDRTAHDLLDACVERGIAVLAAAPFNGELLAREWPREGVHFDYAPAPEHVLRAARALAELCSAQQLPMPHAAMRFPFRHPAVTSVICGMRSAAEVEADLTWAFAELPAGLWDVLDSQTGGVLRER